MNEFFGKGNYEYLLEQMGENELISMGDGGGSGTHKHTHTAPISGGKGLGKKLRGNK